MKRLLSGVRAFHNSGSHANAELYGALADGQSPDTLFFTCADSRVVPAFIATSDPGELFTVRNVGNLIPRLDGDGLSTSDSSEAAAIEYALEMLHVTDVVVCGHSGCGAMAGLVAPNASTFPPNLKQWLAQAHGVLDASKFAASLGQGLPQADVLSQRNVVLQLRALETYPGIRRRTRDGGLRVHGWWFDIASASVQVLRPTEGKFVAFEEAYGSE